MKRIFTAMGGALLLGGMAFSANAADLQPATVEDGLTGGYMCNEYWTPDLTIQYKDSEGEAVDVKFADPKTGYYPWDEEQEDPYEYIEVQMTVPGGETMTVQALISSLGGAFPWNAGTRVGQEEGNAVKFSLGEVEYNFPAGAYKIALPAGVIVAANGDVNPAQEFDWTMVNAFASINDSNIDPRPADGEEYPGMYTQDEMKAVTFNFGEEIKYLEGDIEYANTEDGEALVLDSQYIKIEGTQMVLDLSFLPEGSYIFDIPSGYLLVGNDKIFGGKNYMQYHIWNGLKPATMIDGPEPYGVYIRNMELYYGAPITAVGTFPAIEVYEDWVGDEPLFTIPGENISIQEIPYGEGGEPSTDTDAVTESETISVLYIDFKSLFDNRKGNFIVVVPEGIVESEGALNPKQEFSFQLVSMYEGEPEISITEDGIVEMVWPNAEYISHNYGIDPFLITADGERKNLTWEEMDYETWEYVGDIKNTEDYNGILVTLTPYLLTEGDYALVIPQAYLNISDAEGGSINSEIYYTFSYEGGKTSGIKAVDVVAPAVSGVYNLQGVKVANDANNLPAGLYIINGKKVIVR